MTFGYHTVKIKQPTAHNKHPTYQTTNYFKKLFSSVHFLVFLCYFSKICHQPLTPQVPHTSNYIYYNLYIEYILFNIIIYFMRLKKDLKPLILDNSIILCSVCLDNSKYHDPLYPDISWRSRFTHLINAEWNVM